MSTTTLSPHQQTVALDRPRRVLTWTVVLDTLDRYGAPTGGIVAATLALLLAAVSIWSMDAEGLVLPTFVVLLVAELYLIAHVFHVRHEVDPPLVIILGLTVLLAAIDGGLPEYFAALGQSAIFHRSIASASLLSAVGLPLLCSAIFHTLGGTPSAADAGRYPLVALPALALLALYMALLATLVERGAPELSWGLITNVMGAPVSAATLEPGYANHLLGTLLLIVLTACMSLPIGAATGVFLNEYAPPSVATLVRFCTTSLRGISVLVLAMTAVSLLQLTEGTPLASVLAGGYVDSHGGPRVQGGSFVLAAGIISLLVIPVIARATEEGCRSLPAGLREGSAALGATDGYVLRRIILPWALPNIITGMVLGSAEAAGSLATLLFIAGTGETGVGPFRPVTSLSYAIFDSTYSMWAPFRNALLPHRWAGALLLLFIALTLTAIGLLLKHRYASRYRS